VTRTLGELVWKITGNTSQFDKSVKGASKEMSGLGKIMNTNIGGIKLGLLGMNVTAAAVFAKVVSLTGNAVKQAIDAQETFSKYSIVFSELGDSAETMAQSFADAFDLSSASAKDMLSYTGNILTGFGATQQQALELSVAVHIGC